MKKISVSIMALCMLFCAVGCGDGGGGGGGGNQSWEEAKQTATKLTIYLDESNIYGSYIRGNDEAYVKDCIEKKFYEDTGNAVNIEIMYETHDTFGNKFGGVMSTGGWDAAVSYLGQAGLEETVLEQGVALDVSDLLFDYGEHIMEAVDQQARYATTTLTNEMIGIPSVNNTKMKTILIRKDYMTQVGYTEDKAEAEASGGALKYCQTIVDFDTMLRKMKAEIPGCDMPLIGNAYDIEFTILAGACGTAGYQYRSVNYNEDGSVKEVVPGWISEGYQEMLNYEYAWQKDGIWESDNTVKTDEQRISDFTNGKAAVYCVDPNVQNLINVARQVKSTDVGKNAEFTVLAPLDAVDEQGNAIEGSGAYVEVSRTTDCLIFNRRRAATAELVVKYLDWMYSSVENYELCMYGVEGEHWVKSRDGFYTYPAGKESQFLTRPPYSGAFALLHNDELSYRLYDNYTEQELEWIEMAKNAKTIKNPTDGMLFYNMTAVIANNFKLAEANIYQDCATKAWNGTADPAITFPQQEAAYRLQAADYIQWLTQQYNLYIAQRNSNS